MNSTNLRVRLLASFVYRFLNTMTVPFMAIYLARELGQVSAGILMMVVAVSAVAAALLGGPVCDRVGRRPMLLVGEYGTAAAFAGAAFATGRAHLAPLAYVFFLCATTLYALVLPAHDASIVDVTTPETRKSFYTINYWCVNVAIGAGSMLGSFLYQEYFSSILLLAGIVLLGLGSLTALLVTETVPEGTRDLARSRGLGPRGLMRSYTIVFSDTRYALLLLAATLAISIELQMTNYLTVRLAQDLPTQALAPFLGLTARVSGLQLVGILRLENTALVVVLTLVLLPLLRMLPDRLRIVCGLGLFTAGFMAVAVADVAWVLLAAVLVLTVGEILNVPVKQALIANAVRHEAGGSYMAAFQLTGNLGWVIATGCISLGAAISAWGMAGLYAMFGIVAASVFISHLRRPKAEEASQHLTPVEAP